MVRRTNLKQQSDAPSRRIQPETRRVPQPKCAEGLAAHNPLKGRNQEDAQQLITVHTQPKDQAKRDPDCHNNRDLNHTACASFCIQ